MQELGKKHSEEKTKRSASSFLKLLSQSIPNASPEKLWKDSLALSQDVNATEYYKTLARLNLNRVKNQEVLKDAVQIYHAGFDIKHLLLFLQAPEQAPSGAQTTKDEYLTLWNKEGNFKPRISKKEVVERSVIALRGLLVLAGCATILPGVLVGLSIQDPNTVQTGREMASWAFGVVKDVSDAIFTPTVKNIIGSTMTALGVGMTGSSFIEKRKEAQNIDLRSKIRDGAESPQEQDVLLEKLKDFPKSLQHLISHFSPEETCLFLSSDDETQQRMWQKHPPSFKQRCLSNLVDGKVSETLEKMWQEIKIAGSSWDGDGIFSAPSDLNQSADRLRKHKEKKNEQIEPHNTSIQTPLSK